MPKNKYDSDGVTRFFNAVLYDLGGIPKRVKGDVFGVEIEMEGRNLTPPNGVAGWAPHVDGSLRTNHGEAIEWVTKSPSELTPTSKKVDVLYAALGKNNCRIVTSNRCSTHIHYNVADKQIFQIANLFICYTVFEDLLGRYSGEHRNGNLFCLNVRDCDELVRLMRVSLFEYQNFREFKTGHRYAAINLNAINKFGSVEFRTMRGLDNPSDVKTWVGILNALCEYAMTKMVDPAQFIERLSQVGIPDIVYEVFGNEYGKLLVDMCPDDQLHQSLYEGMRAIQMLAYRISEYAGTFKLMDKDFWEEQAKTKGPFDADDKPVLAAIDPGNERPFRDRYLDVARMVRPGVWKVHPISMADVRFHALEQQNGDWVWIDHQADELVALDDDEHNDEDAPVAPPLRFNAEQVPQRNVNMNNIPVPPPQRVFFNGARNIPEQAARIEEIMADMQRRGVLRDDN